MEKKYIVKPEDKIVIAMAEDDSYEGTFEEVIKYCGDETYCMLLELITNSDNLDIAYGNLFKSVARCDNYDEFNEKVGKEIAGSKTDIKYHRAMAKKYKMILDILQNAMGEISWLYNMHEAKRINIERSIKKYVK